MIFTQEAVYSHSLLCEADVSVVIIKPISEEGLFVYEKFHSKNMYDDVADCCCRP